MKVLSFGLLALFCITFACCHSDKRADAAKLAELAKVAPADAPVFKFDELKHDFGDINQGEQVSYTFKFKNVGKSPLVITKAKASCGCTVPKYDNKLIDPNEDGTIEVTFTASGPGLQYKTVKIFANTIPEIHELNITANVIAKDKE